MKGRIIAAVAVTASCTTSAPSSTDHASAPEIERVERQSDGLPYFVAGKLGTVVPGFTDARVLDEAMKNIGPMFEVSASDLKATQLDRDEIGMTHVQYAQTKNNLRVVGGDLVVHVDAFGVIRSVNGTARDHAMPDATPSINEDVAAGMALAANAFPSAEVAGIELVYVISTADQQPYLAWEVVVNSGGMTLERTYVDAHAGDIVDRRPEFFTARNRTVYDGHGGTYSPFGGNNTQVGTEASPPTEAIALAAYTNTGLTYDCYKTLFNRDSYDGTGGGLKSLVHVRFQVSATQTTGNNAAWTGGQMVYGDGDGNQFTPLAQALDVTTHELTHGVTAATAKLAYQNEPGALNEGMSDIMAATCEAWHDGAISGDTWLVGEDIFTPTTAGDALRYMNNPTKDASLYPASLGGSRDWYADRYQGQEDNGGVHLNSGIPNLAFYLLVAGGTHPRGKTTFTVPGIGIEKAGAIFQRALTKSYMTSNTSFAAARTATEQAADELYPGTKTAVGFAWAAVGVGAAPSGGTDTQAPTVQITSPQNNGTVAPGFTVDVDAMDNVAVLRVELSVDGAVVGTDTTAPYSFTTDPSLTGSHTIKATAYDAFNHADDSITVTVQAPDTGSNGSDTGSDGSDGGDNGNNMNGDSEDPGCGCSSGSAPEGALVLFALLLPLRRRRR
jgi:MYXO-CTERM domain-containing protein